MVPMHRGRGEKALSRRIFVYRCPDHDGQGRLLTQKIHRAGSDYPCRHDSLHVRRRTKECRLRAKWRLSKRRSLQVYRFHKAVLALRPEA